MSSSTFPFRSPAVLLFVVYSLAHLFFNVGEALAQVTPQDCPGAIPVCQNIFVQPDGPPDGQGDIPNELPPSPPSCMDSNERNSTWYTFTVQQSGNLAFQISPETATDDYDWAVYNLTGVGCPAIAANPALEVSCNYSGTPGATGPDGTTNATTQDGSGTPFNAIIPAIAGETYAVNVSNYTRSTDGYILDFTPSTASIFDDLPPALAMVTPPTCPGDSIGLLFSEDIQCATAQSADFQVRGPGGPYTVRGLHGPGCGNEERSFQISTEPPLTQSGAYQVCLTEGAGSVADLCNNLAAPRCLSFDFAAPEIAIRESDSCIGRGAATTLTVSVNGDVAWTPGGQSAQSITVSPAETTQYTVHLVDDRGCNASASTTIEVSDLEVEAGEDLVSCLGDESWTLTAAAFGGDSENGVTYQWEHGPRGATTTVPATTDTYTVTATDAEGCRAVDAVQVLGGRAPSF